MRLPNIDARPTLRETSIVSIVMGEFMDDRRRVRCGAAVAVCWAAAVGAAETSDADLRNDARTRFGSVTAPSAESLAAPAVTLGRALYWDTRLGADGKTACASCHQAADWGADRRPFSVDARGKATARHAQTVFNALLQPTLRWTGDRKSGAHQAEKSLTGSMGWATPEAVVPRLRESGYEAAFRAAYPREPEPMSPSRFAAAVEAYEATLTTPAPFDRFLAGEDAAMSASAKSGLRRFVAVGCADCHTGRVLGGESLEKFGVHKDYRKATGSAKDDAGLFETTKLEADRDRFRVAMLRNVAETAPYFHDGSVADLTAAVQVMADTQLGERLSAEDAKAIVAFLESLTGEVPAHYAPPRPAAD